MNPNIAEYGKKTQFSKDHQPKTQGRKKKVFNWIKEEYDLGQSDLENIINYISMMTQDEFASFAEKIKNRDESVKDMPMIVLKIMQAYGKANVDDIIKLMRATGKATEKREITGKDGQDLPINIIVKGVE
jgi:chorismate mutase